MKMHDLNRRKQEHTTAVEAIRAALREGESSGKPRPFDPDAFKQRVSALRG